MIVNDKPRHYTGLSTDTKPNLGWRGNGYAFLESDTGREYVYSAKAGAWLPLAESVDAPCVGILKIEKTSSEGLIDTYTIYYTNGAQTTYQVTNGGGSSVVANPTLSGDEATLDGLEVDGTKYKVGGGSGGQMEIVTLNYVLDEQNHNITQEQATKLQNGAILTDENGNVYSLFAMQNNGSTLVYQSIIFNNSIAKVEEVKGIAIVTDRLLYTCLNLGQQK